MPSPESKLEVLKLVIERLTADEQYVYIGMDHFAKPTDELAIAQREKKLQRNFQGYSTRAGSDIYAFGMSGVSQIPDAYWQNEKDLSGYYAALDQGRLPFASGYVLSEEDRIRRRVIMRLMCDFELDFDVMSSELGIDFKMYFRHEIDSLSDLQAEGLLASTYRGIEITDPGRLLIRNIAMRFDAHLRETAAPVYSRTI